MHWPRTSAEGEIAVPRARGLGRFGKALGVEGIGVRPPARVAMHGELRCHQRGTFWNGVAGDLVRFGALAARYPHRWVQPHRFRKDLGGIPQRGIVRRCGLPRSQHAPRFLV